LKDYTIFEELRYINHLLSRRSTENNFLTPNKSITRANAFIIKYLISNSHKNIYQKDIETNFGITKSTASTVLKFMEAKDLIKRESVLNDARYKKILPTQKAYEINDKIEKTLYEDEKLLLNCFSKKEQETFKNLLKKLKENIKINEKKEDNND